MEAFRGKFLAGKELPGGMAWPRRSHAIPCVLALSLLLLAGCQTVPRFQAVNLGEGGWRTRQGQGVWKAKRDAPEIAGEILLGERPDGQMLIQFTKTPFPFVIAQMTEKPKKWQIEIPAQNKIYSGPGDPPARLSWLYLAKALRGDPLGRRWKFERKESGDWRLENIRTGEVIEGFLN